MYKFSDNNPVPKKTELQAQNTPHRKLSVQCLEVLQL